MSLSKPTITLRDAILAIGIAASWGVHFVVIRIGAMEVEPLTLLVLRLSLASLVFLPFTSFINWRKLWGLASYSLFYLVGHIGLLFVALRDMEAGLASLIMQLGTPFILVLGWVFFGEKFGLKTTFGLVLALAGVGLIVYRPFDPDFSLFSALIVVVSAFFWAAGALRMRYVGDINFATMTFYSHMIALPFTVLMMLCFEGSPVDVVYNADLVKLTEVLVYQVILMSLSLYWWRGLMNRNPAYLVTPFVLFVPVFGVLSGMIFLGEMPGVNALAGGALVLLGVGIIALRQIQKAQPS